VKISDFYMLYLFFDIFVRGLVIRFMKIILITDHYCYYLSFCYFVDFYTYLTIPSASTTLKHHYTYSSSHLNPYPKILPNFSVSLSKYPPHLSIFSLSSYIHIILSYHNIFLIFFQPPKHDILDNLYEIYNIHL
jgi:hypothetical protein